MIIIYITCKNRKEAREISKALIKENLAACVNYFTAESIYLWNKKITNDKEVVLLVKTVKENFSAIEKRVKQLHSYKIPCIVALSVIKSSKEYFNWVKKTLK